MYVTTFHTVATRNVITTSCPATLHLGPAPQAMDTMGGRPTMVSRHCSRLLLHSTRERGLNRPQSGTSDHLLHQHQGGRGTSIFEAVGPQCSHHDIPMCCQCFGHCGRRPGLFGKNLLPKAAPHADVKCLHTKCSSKPLRTEGVWHLPCQL